MKSLDKWTGEFDLIYSMVKTLIMYDGKIDINDSMILWIKCSNLRLFMPSLLHM